MSEYDEKAVAVDSTFGLAALVPLEEQNKEAVPLETFQENSMENSPIIHEENSEEKSKESSGERIEENSERVPPSYDDVSDVFGNRLAAPLAGTAENRAVDKPKFLSAGNSPRTPRSVLAPLNHTPR